VDGTSTAPHALRPLGTGDAYPLGVAYLKQGKKAAVAEIDKILTDLAKR
jgi:hypothetical protein